MTTKTTKEKFSKDLLKKDALIIVKFFTDWNGASQMILPVYRELAVNYKGIASFYEVNMESDKKTADEFGVREIPTLLFFRKGELVDHVVGMISRNALIAKIENVINQ